MNQKTIGRKIKLYRNKRDMTQAQLAEKLDVSAKHISSIERGITSTSLNKLERIGIILGVSVTSLISDSDVPAPDHIVSEISTLIEDWPTDKKALLVELTHILDKHFKN